MVAPIVSIVDLLHGVWRRRWLVLAITVGLTVLDIGIAHIAPKTYRGEVLLQTDTRASKTLDGEVQQLPADLDGGGLASEADVIKSPNLVLTVIDSLELRSVQPFADILAGKVPGIRERLVGRALRLWPGPLPGFLQGLLEPSDTRSAEEIARDREQDLVDYIEKHLGVGFDQRGRSLRISYESGDPVLAARMANAIAEAYVGQQMRQKTEVVLDTSAWLTEQLARLRARAVESENKLAEFRQSHRLGTAEAPTFTQQQLADLNAQLVTVVGQQAQAEARYREADQAMKTGHLSGISAVLASVTIQGLRREEAAAARTVANMQTQQGSQNPNTLRAQAELSNVRAAIAEETDRIVASLRSEVQIAQDRRAALEQRIAEVTRGADDKQQAFVQLGILEREAAANREVFESVVRRTEETRVLDGLQHPDVRIVASARIPVRPSSPKMGLVAALGFMSSLAVAVGAALLLEHWYATIRSVAQGERLLAITAAAWLPWVKLRRREYVHDVVVADAHHRLSDALRSLGMMMAACFPQGRQVVLITSATTGEGKTSLAIGYARTLAKTGRSCLLIDADLRRPAVAARLHGENNVGLSDVVAGRVTLEEALQTDVATGLQFLSAGRMRDDPLRTLGSQRFLDLLASVRSQFGVVVIDSPPQLAVPDSTLLARHADVVLLVIAWARTPLRMATKALSRLRIASNAPMAFVLGGVDPARIGRTSIERYSVDYAPSRSTPAVALRRITWDGHAD
jgi:capsular exopolysaccharide synthesis family protein